MPPQILQLPLEIINAILQALMPPLGAKFEMMSLHNSDKMRDLPVPLDLCRLLAVCRAFHEVASPWVWRRVAICLRDEVFKEGATNFLGRMPARRNGGKMVPGQWDYLRDHPETASHIRLLTLHIRNSASSQTLTAFQAAMSFMTGLQVLRLICDRYVKTTSIDPIYFGLISKQHLHRIIISEYFSPIVAWNFPTTSALTHIKVQGWRSGFEHLLLAAQGLQSLEISTEMGLVLRMQDVGSAWEKLPIPWGTLRKITLKNFADCFEAFHNLESWKQSFPGRSSPLSEVTIDNYHPLISPEDINPLTQCGQDLRVLHLSIMHHGDYEAFFNRISAAFPRLQNLAIFFNSSRLNAWKATLSTINDFLKRLPLLERLDWNYLDEKYTPVYDPDDNGTDALYEWDLTRAQSFPRITSGIAPESPALKHINFHGSDYYISCEIMRDDMGRYEDQMEVEVPKDEFPHLFMSHWDDQMYDHI